MSFDANATEDADEEKEDDGALDVMIFFNYQSGSSPWQRRSCANSMALDDAEDAIGGGDVVYTIKNEDETVGSSRHPPSLAHVFHLV